MPITFLSPLIANSSPRASFGAGDDVRPAFAELAQCPDRGGSRRAGYVFDAWYAVLAEAALPVLIDKLSRAIMQAVNAPDVNCSRTGKDQRKHTAEMRLRREAGVQNCSRRGIVGLAPSP